MYSQVRNVFTPIRTVSKPNSTLIVIAVVVVAIILGLTIGLNLMEYFRYA